MNILPHKSVFTSSLTPLICNLLLLLSAMLFVELFPKTVMSQETPQATQPVATPGHENRLPDRYEKIYVPEKDLGQLWTLHEGVLLETEKFHKLLEQAQSVSPLTDRQPAGFTIEGLTYQAEIQGDVLEIQARCQLVKLNPSWSQLVLPLHNVSLKQATLNGKPAPLGLMKDSGGLILLEQFVGRQELLLTLTAPIQRAGTDEVVSFAVFPESAATLLMKVASGRILQFNGQKVETEAASTQNRDVSVPVGGEKVIQLRLTDSLKESLEESLVFATTEYSVQVEREHARWQANCHISSFGTRFQKLEFLVPATVEIADVQAEGLQGWELQDVPDQAGQTKIVLAFREAIPERITVTFLGIQILKEQSSWRLAPLRLLGATTHTGGLAVSAADQVRLKTEFMEGIRPAKRTWRSAAEFMRGLPARYYEIWNDGFVLEFSQSEIAGEAQAAVSHVLAVDESGMKLTCVLTLQALFAPLFDVNLEIPAGWKPEQISQGQQQLDWQYITTKSEQQALRVLLNPPLKPEEKRPLAVVLKWSEDSQAIDRQPRLFKLPDVKIPGVKILEGTYVITASPLLEVIPQQVTGMDAALIGLEQERFGFRYQNAEVSGDLQVSRKPARFQASTLQVMSVDDQQTRLTLETTLNIEGGGLRQVAVQLEKLSDIQAEFVSVGDVRITEQNRNYSGSGTNWLLTFDRHLTGKVPLRLDVIAPRNSAAEVVIPELIYPLAELQETHLFFAAEAQQHLAASLTDSSGHALYPLDPTDFSHLPATGERRIVMGYHLVRPGLQGSLAVENYDVSGVPMAIGQQLQLTTLLLETGLYQQQAVLKLKFTGLQGLLLNLPEQARLWSTTVNGIPVSVRQGEQGYLLSLAEVANPETNESQQIQVIYALPAGTVQPKSLVSLELPAPEFSVLDGQGKSHALRILQTDWILHHEPGGKIQTTDTGIQTIQKPSDDSWLSGFLRHMGNLNWSQSGGLLLLGFGLCLVVMLMTGVFYWINSRVLENDDMSKLAALLSSLAIVLVFAFVFLGMQARGFMSGFRVPAKYDGKAAASPGAWDDVVIAPTMEMPEESRAFDRLHGVESPVHVESHTSRENAGNQRFEVAGTMTKEMPAQAVPTFQPHRSTIINRTSPDPLATPQSPPFGVPQGELEQAIKPVEKMGITADRSDGLLSLPLQLIIPETLLKTHLRSLGSEQQNLEVRYFSQTSLKRLRWAIAMVCLLLFWFQRRANLRQKLQTGILIPGICLALLGVVPELWQPVLEGVILGSIAGVGLWLLIGLMQCLLICQRKFCQWWSWCQSVTAALLLSVCFLVVGEQTVLAQEKPVASSEHKKIPLIYSYQQEQAPLAAERMFVPREEYMRLWKLANPDEVADAPVDSLVHEASYVAEFLKGSDEPSKPMVAVKGRYIVQNYRRAEQLVSLPIQPSILDSLEVNGESVAGVLQDNKQLAVLVKPGVHLVDVQCRFPAETFGAAGHFSVSLLPVASGSFAFRLSEGNTQLKVNDGKIPSQLVSREEVRYAEIPVNSGGAFQFAWQPQLTGERSQFLSCQSAREVFFRDHGVELQYVFDLQVAQGGFTEVLFQLPADVKLKSLSGEDLAGWQVTGADQLRILLKKEIQSKTRLTLELYTPLSIAENAVELVIPDVVPLGVTREVGTWGIHWEDSLSLQFRQTEGVRQLQNSQFERLASQALIPAPQRVYRFTGRPQRLVVDVSRKQPETQATHYTLMDIQPHKMHLATVADVSLQGEARLSLEFSVPANLQIVELSATSLEDWFVTANEAGEDAVLTVLFAEPQQGAVRVVIRGHIQQEARGGEVFSLLCPLALHAKQVTSYLGIGVTEMLDVSLKDNGSWTSVVPAQLPSLLKGMPQFPIRIGLTNTSRNPGTVAIQLKREQAQLKGSSVCVIAVTESSVDYGISLQWTVSSAATDQFQLLGPAWFSGKMEFQSEQIRQVTTTPVDNEQILWSIETKKPISGPLLVTAVVSLPVPEDRVISSAALKFVAAGPADEKNTKPLENQEHYAVLVNLGQDPLELMTGGSGRTVEARELPLEIPDNMARQAMDILKLNPTENVRWILKQVEQQESPPATVSLAELTTSIDGSGNWRTRGVYHVKNRQRQFLPVILPENAGLLSVQVHSQPVKAVHREIANQQVLLIPIPTAGAADLAFPVEIVLEGKLATPLISGWKMRRVSLPRPTLLSSEAAPDFGVPVLHTVWKVSTPKDLAMQAVSGAGTNMSLSSRRNISQLAINQQLQEISELSKIIRLKGSTYQQKLRAAENLKQLRDSLALSPALSYDGARSERESTGVDSGQGMMLNDVQIRILTETDQDLQILQQELQPGSELQLSRGRAYILENNGYILQQNLSAGPSGTNTNHSSMSQMMAEEGVRFVLPALPKGATAKPETQLQMRDSLSGAGASRRLQTMDERRSLSEENLRQNSLIQQQAVPALPEKKQKTFSEIHDNSFRQVKPSAQSLGLEQTGREGSVVDTAENRLSLQIELPEYEQLLVYSKVGGDPELMMQVYSRDTVSKMYGWGWMLLVCGVLVFLLYSVPSILQGKIGRRLAVLLLVSGLLMFACCPGLAAVPGLALALLASILFALAGKQNAEQETRSTQNGLPVNS